MASEPPTPPATLPTETVTTLNEAPEERLRDVASYAEALADHKESKARLKRATGKDDVAERMDIAQRMSLPKRRSRSRISMTIAITTGSGGKEVASNQSTNLQ